jgi:predicted O-methyltransferase YrrM
MSKSMNFSETVLDYAADVGVREHPAQKACREDTAKMGGISRMQIAPEQGAFMALTAKLMGAKRYIEVGTFTGYSALSVALALGNDGHVDALDISDEYVGKARAYWAAAGVDKKITAHIGPATATLDQLLKSGRANAYDFAFIDADKSGYDAYYEAMLKLVRPGGLIAIDNVLWSGKVCDPTDTTADTQALRALNAKIKRDERVDTVLLPFADGIFMCRKR